MDKACSKTSKEVLSELGSSAAHGLTAGEAAARLKEYGPNLLIEAAKKTTLQKFIDQFKEFLIVLLMVSAAISAVFGEFGDAIAIMAIVILNAAIGVIQENKAENALEALKKMTNPKTRVVRDGRPELVDSSSLVPGDIVLIDAGDIISADMRLIESALLRIDEAALTGESVPVEKSSEMICDEDVSLGDRRNMAYMGTSVNYGRGKAVVVSTGMGTEVGHIAGMLQQEGEERTPLQVTLDKLGKMLGAICIALCVIVFIAGLLRGEEPLVMFMTAVSLAVAAIPEGLPAIVTIVLAIGVQRMARSNAIIRRLPAVETLGSASVICSDKTGTLTTNKMVVKHVEYHGRLLDVTGIGDLPEGEFLEDGVAFRGKADEAFTEVFKCAMLCNDASYELFGDGSASVTGDPTEACMLIAGAKAGFWKKDMDASWPRLSEIPFDSERKRMSTLHAVDSRVRMYTKGAPDELLRLSTKLFTDEGAVEMDDALRQGMDDAYVRMAESGMRVLSMSYKDLPSLPDEIGPHLESDMVFLGHIAMQDPARKESMPAVAACHKAGIIPVMITGDHKTTALSIAKQVGIADGKTRSLSGKELDKLSDTELSGIVEDVRVYARVSPEHKMRIVDAWRAKGHIVAMTGDGVNDAPALKKADIGVAMGITGTDVAKGAADMILTDDNFATIVKAVEEGRTIYSNIRKSVQYLIRCNIGEIVLVFVSILAGIARPLHPIQILWVNLITDSMPAIALGVDPPEKGTMDMRPRKQKDPVLGASHMARLAAHGIMLGFVSLATFVLGSRHAFGGAAPGVEAARTMCLLTLTFGQLFTSLSVSCSEGFIFKVGILRNQFLLKAILISGVLQVAVVYIPYVNSFLRLVPLSALQVAISAGLALLMIPVAEILKIKGRARKDRR